MKDISPEERRLYGSVDAASAGQNVCVYCASEGLATVNRVRIDFTRPGTPTDNADVEFFNFFSVES